MSIERVERIEARLREVFGPEHLAVEDESHRHVGHPGAREGGGHFRVEIVAPAFEGQGRLARHRAVYAALDEMMRADIHALAVRALTPSEWARAPEAGPGG